MRETGSGRGMVIGVVKFLVVVVGAVAVGAGVGIGLSVLSGSGGTEETPIAAMAPHPAATATAAATASPTAEPTPSSERKPKVTILDARLTEYENLDGRARLTLRVRMHNRGSAPLDGERPKVVVAAGSTHPDPKADRYAGALLEPVPPGGTATGELRFETAGEVTDELAAGAPAKLWVAGRARPVKLPPA